MIETGVEIIMKTTCFDALLEGEFPEKTHPFKILLINGETEFSVSVSPFEDRGDRPGDRFVRIESSSPVDLRSGDAFEIRDAESKTLLVEGRVLSPCPQKKGSKTDKKSLAFLERLSRGGIEMLAALTQAKGSRGLGQAELLDFTSIPLEKLLTLSQRLELEGEVRILGFSPLLLISREGFDFLCQKIIDAVRRYHDNHPQDAGIPVSRIKTRFNTSQRILSMALRYLIHSGQTKEQNGRISLGDFEPEFSPEEQELLGQLEEIAVKGELRSVTVDELQKTFHLSPDRLDKLLSRLVERRKVVHWKDGFILHSRWLEDVIDRLRTSGKKELSVTEFKALTGLTRKYAIPLLELLDQMGVTKRKGDVRLILGGS